MKVGQASRMRGRLAVIAILLFTMLVGEPLYASMNSIMAKKEVLVQQYPGLFESMEVSKQDGIPRVTLNLKALLKVVLAFSRTVESQSLNKNIAEAAKISTANRNAADLKLGMLQGKTHAVSSTDLSGEDGNSYLQVAEVDSTTAYATLSKKNNLGMMFSSTLSQTNSKTYLKDTAQKDAELKRNQLDDPLITNSLEISVAIPVIQDWGEVNEIPDWKADLNLERSRTHFQSVRLSLCTEISKIYWNLVGIIEQIEALEGAVALSQKLVSENQERFQLGALDQVDWVRSKVTLSQNRQKLLEAEIQRKNILSQIRTYLSLEDVYFEIIPEEKPSLHTEKLREDNLKGLIEKRNPDVILANHSLELNTYEFKEVENKDSLDVDLTFSYKANSYGASGDNEISEINKQDYNDYSVALTWNIPLFDDRQESDLLQKTLQKEQLVLNRKEVISQKNIQLQTILRNLEYNIEENRSATENLTLSKLLLDQELEKFKLGQTTSYKLSEAQETYTQAQLLEILTRVHSEQNYMSLLHVTGDLLSKYGIEN